MLLGSNLKRRWIENSSSACTVFQNVNFSYFQIKFEDFFLFPFLLLFVDCWFLRSCVLCVCCVVSRFQVCHLAKKLKTENRVVTVVTLLVEGQFCCGDNRIFIESHSRSADYLTLYSTLPTTIIYQDVLSLDVFPQSNCIHILLKHASFHGSWMSHWSENHTLQCHKR